MRIAGGSARLDQFVLDIEFLLISVVQGVALSALAAAAILPITTMQYEYWPYIISAFLVIFIFWSQAIIHALSFIEWPLDLSHNFFYFLASLVQVIVFSQIMHPQEWFIGMTVLFIVAFFLYIVDYQIIKSRQADYKDDKNDTALYRHLKRHHEIEMYFMVPAGLLFNALSAYLLFKHTFPHYYFVGVQILFELFVLATTIHTFKKRAQFIYDRIV